ncbi:molybdate ABC transporter substrate-binding protein [Paenibacillus thailandensis]|uniref:molybdate ABC transporter substrate-binding protein n=1 Tax=Paenibacillus thailandensis TaxID=393250 RepID=UPI0036429180
MKGAYESEHPVRSSALTSAPSGALQQQIENGAPADLFLSAADRNMRALVDAGLIEESKQTALLRNELVLVAASDDARSDPERIRPDEPGHPDRSDRHSGKPAGRLVRKSARRPDRTCGTVCSIARTSRRRSQVLQLRRKPGTRCRLRV